MLKKSFSISLFLLITLVGAAQKNNKVDKSASFTIAFGSKQFSTALGYQHLWKIGKKQKLGIGGGLRLTNNFGNNLYYTTAPAKLTSGKTGPAVFFADDIVQNIDSVLFKKSQTNALNLSINFTYNIYKKITLGFNIDAIGFSFGGKQNGAYLGNGGIGAATSAKPTGFNVLLISDNDRGTLNSEFFAQYKLNDKWGAKLGFQYLFTEYTTDTKVQTTPDGQKNDRFRSKSSSISLGVTRSF
jgi:hypothetical protein